MDKETQKEEAKEKEARENLKVTLQEEKARKEKTNEGCSKGRAERKAHMQQPKESPGSKCQGET